MWLKIFIFNCSWGYIKNDNDRLCESVIGDYTRYKTEGEETTHFKCVNGLKKGLVHITFKNNQNLIKP